MVGGAVVGGRVVINAQNGSGEVVVSWGWGKNHLKSLGTPHARSFWSWRTRLEGRTVHHTQNAPLLRR